MHSSSPLTLRVIRLAHTAVWTFLVLVIAAIPYAAWHRRYGWFLALVAVVMAEVVVLALNGMRCPLTGLAARYTDDRRANFDIYLPLTIAQYNKEIFGTLFLGGVLFGLGRMLT